MSFVSYAQNFEDVRLWRAFSDIAVGRYIDVGTQDPVQDSVSLAFYERGWRGVHVEPTPAYAAAIRSARPDEMVIEAAVSTLPGPIRFFEIPSTGLSTGIQDLAERHVDAGWSLREILVPTVTLGGLFELMGDAPIHWLKVDVEGMEADVLSSWGDHPARPAALVIEATAPNTQTQTHLEWYNLALSRGYRDVLFDGLSRYFIHESHAERGAALALSPNVFDGFQIASSHFAAGKLRSEHQAALEAEQQQAEARREEAVSAANTQAETALEAMRTALQAQLTETERLAGEARNALAAKQEDHLNLLREAGRLQGLLTAQAEAAETRLRDLAQRLAESEQALDKSRDSIADLRDHIQTLVGEHAISLARVNASLEAMEVRGVQLSEQLSAANQRLAESEAGREQAERQRDESSRQYLERIGGLNTTLEQLRAQLAWREDQLTQLVRLIDQAPDPLAGWPQRVATLLARIAGRHPARVVAGHTARVRSWLAEQALPIGEPPDRKGLTGAGVAEQELNWVREEFAMSGVEDPIDTVPKLLTPHDAVFINMAYKAVLGRNPDSHGGTYYLGRLRTGTHKLEILRQLRRSAEGGNFIPGVAGLDRAIRRHRLANLPFLGPIVRLLINAEGNSATQRQLRVIVNEIGRLQHEQAALTKLMVSRSWNHGAEIPQTTQSLATNQAAGNELLPERSISTNPRDGLAGFFQAKMWGR